MSPHIDRNDVAVYLRFADRPIKETGTIAWPFVGDYGDDGDIVGVEIVCDENRRAKSEAWLLAFAVFSAALESLRASYNDALVKEASLAAAVRKKAECLADAVGLELRVVTEIALPCGMTADLAITDSVGNVLLLAEIKRRPFSKSEATNHDQIKSSIAQLGGMMRQVDSRAIGVCTFIDEFGDWYNEGPVDPGSWIDWPETVAHGADRHLWAHIAILPPSGDRPLWLPEHFQHTEYLCNGTLC